MQLLQQFNGSGLVISNDFSGNVLVGQYENFLFEVHETVGSIHIGCITKIVSPSLRVAKCSVGDSIFIALSEEGTCKVVTKARTLEDFIMQIPTFQE